jgi:hypothetical protein
MVRIGEITLADGAAFEVEFSDRNFNIQVRPEMVV